ncbi:hypothetical protein Ptr902_01861 [Pyrenophora tritici-repentis]|nr:hypothetical protein Ptr902_01861 [Pyrenophora tritici-repentis]
MKSITFITILSLIAVSYADPNFPCYNNGVPCTIDGDNYAGMKRAKCG